MKNFISILIALFLLNFTGNAQNSKFQIGIDGGPNLSSIRGFEQLITIESTIGYSVALTFQINFANHFSLVTGAGFEQKGNQTKEQLGIIDSDGIVSKHKIRMDYNYMNVPLQARYTFGQKKFKGFVNAGGYLGFLLNSSTYVVGLETAEPKDTSENFETIDFGITAGIGMSYSITDKLALTVEVRNNLGLYNISSVPIYDDGTNKLNSTNFLLGFNYGFGSK